MRFQVGVAWGDAAWWGVSSQPPSQGEGTGRANRYFRHPTADPEGSPAGPEPGHAVPAIPEKGSPSEAAIALLPSLYEAGLEDVTPGGAPSTRRPTGLRSRPQPEGDPGVEAAQAVSVLEEANPSTYWARCSSPEMTRAIEVVEASGLRVTRVTPADWAWAAAAFEAAIREGGAAALCVVDTPGDPGETRLIGVRVGDVVALRRLPRRAGPKVLAARLSETAERLQGPDRPPPKVIAFGPDGFRENVSQSVQAAGLGLLKPTGPAADLGADSGAVAAAYAGSGPAFIPPTLKARAGRRRKRGLAAALGAAAVLLIASAFLETMNLDREIAAVRTARAAHGDTVEAVLNTRQRLQSRAEILQALSDGSVNRRRWTSVFTAVSEALPTSTVVTRARTAGDTLFLDMEGPDAAATLEAVGELDGLSGFRASAPVIRELNGGSEILERFSAMATVDWSRLQPDGGGDR